MQYEIEDFIQWPQPFKNDSAHTVPPFGCMIQKSPGVITTDLNGDLAILCDRPGTTFTPTVFVNGRYAITPGKFGRCCPIGNCPVAHEPTWTPAYGEAGGIKPDSFLLFKGYPASVRVLGVAIAEDKVLWGKLHEITSLLCKATAQNSAGTLATDTSDYTIMQGTPGSETSAGFTTQPAIYSRSDIMVNEWFSATLRNGVWYADLEDNAWLGKADSAISAGSSGTVSLWTGTPGSESDSGANATSIRNRTSVDIPSGGWVRIGRVNGKFYCEPWSC